VSGPTAAWPGRTAPHSDTSQGGDSGRARTNKDGRHAVCAKLLQQMQFRSLYAPFGHPRPRLARAHFAIGELSPPDERL
jgi:hypothetical protein